MDPLNAATPPVNFSELFRLMSGLTDVNQKGLHKVLDIACNILGMENGLISKIDCVEKLYQVEFSYAAQEEAIQVGSIFELGNTYCNITVNQEEVIAISEVFSSNYKGHPCFELYHLIAYIGVPIYLDGKKYGTLNFSSSRRKKGRFTDFEKQLIQNLGNWVSNFLTNRKTKEQLQLKNDQLQKLLLEQDNITDFLIHDLRTPIANLKSLVEILEYDIDVNESLETFSLINKSLNVAFKLIDNVRAIQVIDNQEEFAEEKTVDLNEMLEDISSFYGKRSEAKNIQIILSITEKIQLQSIPSLLYQSIANLVSNAIKFSPKGKRIWLEGYLNDGQIVITVKDEGPGFTESDRKKLFTRFQKLSAKPTAKEPSTGLGLYIVKRACDRIGGNITLALNTPDGASFQIAIPIKAHTS